jgi:RNA polymerase sigma-70 factor (ECF subfamily)
MSDSGAHDLDMQPKAASSIDGLFPEVYRELKTLALWHLQRERADHTLQATALVHEAYVRLNGRNEFTLCGKGHLLSLVSTAMRQILIDYARRRKAAKRSCDTPWLLLGGTITIQTPEEFLDLDRALQRLQELDPRGCRLFELHCFCGLPTEELATHLGISERSVRRELAHARAWLQAATSQTT